MFQVGSRRLLAFTAALLGAVGAAAHSAQEPLSAAPHPGLVVVQAGAASVAGVLLDATGHIAVAATEARTNWVVQQGDQRYPARIVAAHPDYGLTVLKVDREQPFEHAVFAQRPDALDRQVRLVSPGPSSGWSSHQIGVRRLRRGVQELKLRGSYYELTLPPAAAPATGVLLDAAAGDVLGLLLPERPDSNVRFALLASTVVERAASSAVPIGIGGPPEGPAVLFADGAVTKLPTARTLRLLAGEQRSNITYASAVQDWRQNSGLWIDSLLGPSIAGETGILATNRGQIHCVNLKTMAATWHDSEPQHLPILFPPVVAGDRVVTGMGSLGMVSYQRRDSFLSLALGFDVFKARRVMVDYGRVVCHDRQSGVFKWSYPPDPNRWLRFPGAISATENRAVVGGMGMLTVLNMADGRTIWSLPYDRKDLSPDFYLVGGIVGDTFWALKSKVKMHGSGKPNDRFRLALEEKSLQLASYRIDGDGKPLQKVSVATTKGAPALSGGLVLDSVNRVCYGATGKNIFAVSMDGKLLWQKPLFSEQFGGHLVFSQGMLFATESNHRLHAIDPVDGEQLWTFSAAGAPLAAPLVHDGHLYVGSLDTWVYALHAGTGKQVWKLESTGRACGRPAIVDGKLYFASDDGRFVELPLPE